MKKHLFLFTSLVLSFMVSSCQNDIEEVMNTNEDTALTRSIDDTSDVVNEEAPDDINNLLDRSSVPTLTGSSIIQGTEIKEYEVDFIPTGTYLDWYYNSSVFDLVGSTSTSIYLRLKNSGATDNTYVTAYFRDNTTNAITYSTSINVGANGPHYADCSIRVVRSSDGLEAYPSSYGLRPNTWYYGYFSTTTGASLSLNWDFTYSSCSNPTGTPVYFKSGANGYDLVDVYGTLSGSSVLKLLLGVTLYGGSDKKGIEDEESEETPENISEEE
jgi:hypothetical protein